MNRNKSTISRELSRNTGKRGYRHKQANRLADERHQKKNKAIKLTDCVKNYIRGLLKIKTQKTTKKQPKNTIFIVKYY